MEVHWLEDFLALVPVSVADNHGHPRFALPGSPEHSAT